MRRIRVLVVEDSMFFRELMVKTLSKDPALEIVASARDAFEARDAIIKYRPDVMTLDIEMPRMSGIEALQAIKAIREDVKVIMCSAMGQQSMVIEAIQAGAKDFIVKPFQADRVIESIRKVLG